MWCEEFGKFYVFVDVCDKASSLFLFAVFSNWWVFVVICVFVESLFLRPVMLICSIFSDVGPGCGWMSSPSKIRDAS